MTAAMIMTGTESYGPGSGVPGRRKLALSFWRWMVFAPVGAVAAAVGRYLG